MHLIILSGVLQLLCIIHLVRTGRPYWWIWIILIGSFLGVAAYAITQILPDFQNSPRARNAARGVVKKLDPTRDLRRLRDELARADTVRNRLELGREFLALGEAAEAEEVFRGCLKGMHASDPDILLALAQAQFVQDKAAETRKTLDGLIAANPDFRSDDGHLLYARALEALGEEDAALAEYRALEPGYPGEEARVRMAELLIRRGQGDEARTLLEQSLARARVAPRYYQKAQKDWLDKARALLK